MKVNLYDAVSLNAAAGKPGTWRHRVAAWAAEILLSAINSNPSLRGQLHMVISSISPTLHYQAGMIGGRPFVLPADPVTAPMPKVKPTLGERLISTDFPGERRSDRRRTLVLIAAGDGYVMARSPGCAPVVMTLWEWRALPPDPVKK